MQNNWETMSNMCCPECGHLLADRKETCTFCNDNQIYDYKDEKSLDQDDNYISFDDEIYFGDINYDDEL